jgi:hypothetical protein
MPTQLQVRFRDTVRCRLTAWAFSAAAFTTALLFAPGVGESQSAIPAWIPIYPGAKVTDTKSQPGGTESYLWFTISTRDACGRVWRFYDEKLKLAGFNVVTDTIADDCPNVIRAHTARGEREVNLSGGLRISYNSSGNPVRNTEYGLEVVQRGSASGGSIPRGGARQDTASDRIPAWVPAYPGSVPQGISGRREGRENSVSFRFTSRDDTRRILSWYQDRLRQMGFTVSMDLFGTNGALRSNTRDQSRAVKIDLSAAGGQNVVVLEIRDGR